MHQLSGLEAAFLGMETSSVHGHVGNVCVFDPATAHQPLTLERLTGLVESRLHLIPAFRRRLITVPLGLDHPYWIEDPDLDLEYHVRELALPAPGDDRQLGEQVSRIHARHLDRSRPLWELYLVHGLEGGRMATYLKVQHATIDGVSGNDLFAALMDLTPEGRTVEPPPEWVADRVPGQAELLVRGALSLGSHPLRAARLTYGLAGSIIGITRKGNGPSEAGASRHEEPDIVLANSSDGLRAPATPFNRSVGPHRRWAFSSVPFATVRAARELVEGATVNDVVIALCAGALRRWLVVHDALPDAPLVAAVPVSVRTANDPEAGVKISMMIASIPTNLPDPGGRLRATHNSMRSAKEVHGALPAKLLSDVAEFAMPALISQAARLSARFRLLERLSPFNLIISNVPGPQLPLYFGGTRLLAYYPVSAVTDGQGLNITAISYDGQVFFGILAARELVPDVQALAEFLKDELAQLSVRPDGTRSTPRRARKSSQVD